MFLTFGEVMARIAPPGHLRWRQSVPGHVEVTWGGGEANVAASLAMFGNLKVEHQLGSLKAVLLRTGCACCPSVLTGGVALLERESGRRGRVASTARGRSGVG